MSISTARDDSIFALSAGLFEDNVRSDYYKRTNYPCQTDFKELAKRMGLSAPRAEKLIQPFVEKQTAVSSLIQHSFLAEATKRGYGQFYRTKRNHLERM